MHRSLNFIWWSKLFITHTQLQCVGSSTFSIIKSFVIIIWPLVHIIRSFYSQRAYVHCVCIHSVRTSTTRHFHLIFNIYYLFTYFCEQMIFVSFDKVFSVACMHVCMIWQAKGAHQGRSNGNCMLEWKIKVYQHLLVYTIYYLVRSVLLKWVFGFCFFFIFRNFLDSYCCYWLLLILSISK